MQYFKIAPGRFIQYDETANKSDVIDITQLEEYKDQLEARISASDPNEPKTDAEWIAYGKSQYPFTDHTLEQAELLRVQSIITEIEKLNGSQN